MGAGGADDREARGAGSEGSVGCESGIWSSAGGGDDGGGGGGGDGGGGGAAVAGADLTGSGDFRVGFSPGAPLVLGLVLVAGGSATSDVRFVIPPDVRGDVLVRGGAPLTAVSVFPGGGAIPFAAGGAAAAGGGGGATFPSCSVNPTFCTRCALRPKSVPCLSFQFDGRRTQRPSSAPRAFPCSVDFLLVVSGDARADRAGKITRCRHTMRRGVGGLGRKGGG